MGFWDSFRYVAMFILAMAMAAVFGQTAQLDSILVQTYLKDGKNFSKKMDNMLGRLIDQDQSLLANMELKTSLIHELVFYERDESPRHIEAMTDRLPQLTRPDDLPFFSFISSVLVNASTMTMEQKIDSLSHIIDNLEKSPYNEGLIYNWFLGKIYAYLGLSHVYNNNHREAIENNYQSINYYHNSFDPDSRLSVIYQTGRSLALMGNYPRANDFFESIYYDFCHVTDKKSLESKAKSVHFLGIICLDEKDTVSWEAFVEQSIHEFTNMQSPNAIPPLSDLIEMAAYKGEKAKLSHYIQLMEEILHLKTDSANRTYNQAVYLAAKAQEALIQGKAQTAYEYIQKAENADLRIGSMYRFQLQAADFAMKAGDGQNAFGRMQRAFNLYKETMAAEEIEKSAKIEKSFELRRKELETQIAKQEKENINQRLQTQRNFNLIIFIGLLIFVGLSYNLYLTLQRLKKEKEKTELQSQALEVAKEKAERASLEKADFLSFMSHEIRTPLNSVIGMANIIRDDEPREDQKTYLDTLNFSANSLLLLVNDILDFNKIEAGKIELEKIPFDLNHTCQLLANSFKIRADLRNIELHYHSSFPSGEESIGDPTRLTQILNNLMSNAIKFTHKGKVELTILEGSQAGWKRFEIKDTGIGIKPDNLEKIFHSFSQADTSTTREYGGTGLGLHISQRLVQLMGGQMEVASQEGVGSTFAFEVPLPPHHATLHSSPQATSQSLTIAGKRILVAEDNTQNQFVLKEYFNRWGVSGTFVGNGQEAIDQLGKEKYDLVVLDQNMPIMDGKSTIVNIRSNGHSFDPQLPILVLSASVSSEEVKDLMEVGADGFLSKPFDPKQLLGRIANLLA
ncbi:MAG: ATP-binding protein [Bacteroidota bacterium]